MNDDLTGACNDVKISIADNGSLSMSVLVSDDTIQKLTQKGNPNLNSHYIQLAFKISSVIKIELINAHYK